MVLAWEQNSHAGSYRFGLWSGDSCGIFYVTVIKHMLLWYPAVTAVYQLCGLHHVTQVLWASVSSLATKGWLWGVHGMEPVSARRNLCLWSLCHCVVQIRLWMGEAVSFSKFPNRWGVALLKDMSAVSGCYLIKTAIPAPSSLLCSPHRTLCWTAAAISHKRDLEWQFLLSKHITQGFGSGPKSGNLKVRKDFRK